MQCFRCGSSLGSGKFCLRCGADVSLYRKIIRLSNRYYNIGLERAQVRDMTGAIEALTRSLEINKKNIPARNLLGLVLYETGELVDALCQWVISTHYEPENNPASEYVQQIQDDKSAFSVADQSIRKYNVALDQAKHGSEDLAIIQLQWVVKQHPKMLKAHQLLAVLYLWEGSKAKAEKELKIALRLDRGSTFCLRLSQEMKEPGQRNRKSVSELLGEGARERVEQVRETAQTVQNTWRSRPAFWLRFLTGALILLCISGGILVPTIRRRQSRAVSDAVAGYSRQLENLRKQLTNEELTSEAYNVLLQMSLLDTTYQREQLKALFEKLDPYQVNSDIYKSMYTYWRNVLVDQTDNGSGSAAD